MLSQSKSLLLLLLGSVVMMAGTASLQADDKVSFRRDIAPLLRDRCLACHGPKKAEGGYRVDSYERAIAEGDSGAAAFYPESEDDSEALRRMLSEDVDERMPLEGDPLPKDQIKLFRDWIAAGAEFDGSDPQAPLTEIIPAPSHPPAPETYASTVPITAVQFSRDGDALFAAGYHELLVWNPTDGKLLRRIGNMGQRIYGIDLNAAGDLLAVACGAPGRHGEARLVDPESGEVKRVVGLAGDVVLDAKFSPDGKRLAVASAESELQVYDVATGERQLEINSHSDWVTAVAWSPDGKQLVSGSRDKTAKVFNAESGELLTTYSGHKKPVHAVAFHPDGAQVYSTGADRKLHRWKAADGKKAAEANVGEAFRIDRSDGTMLLASNDRTVRELDSKSQSERRKLAGHVDWVVSADFHAATKRIAAGAFDGRILVWNAEDGKQIASFLAVPK